MARWGFRWPTSNPTLPCIYMPNWISGFQLNMVDGDCRSCQALAIWQVGSWYGFSYYTCRFWCRRWMLFTIWNFFLKRFQARNSIQRLLNMLCMDGLHHLTHKKMIGIACCQCQQVQWWIWSQIRSHHCTGCGSKESTDVWAALVNINLCMMLANHWQIGSSIWWTNFLY